MLELLGMLLFLFLIGLSIALHELGHLIPAKKFGVKVTEYAIGFGPSLFSRKWGETEVRLRLLPFGGFIRMIGMYLPARSDGKVIGGRFADTIAQAREQARSEITAEDEARTFYRLSVPKRLVVMIGGPFMNLVLAFVIFTVTLVGIGTPSVTTTVGSIVPCVPVETDLSGEGTIAGCVDSASTPAVISGIQVGDKLLAVNGFEISEWFDLSAALEDVPAGQSVNVDVLRGAQNVTLTITPAAAAIPVFDENGEATGEFTTRPFIGIGPDYVREQQALLAVPQTMWDLLQRSLSALSAFPARIYELGVGLITGAERDPEGPISVVGATRIGGEIAASELTNLDKMFSILSLAASLNLFLFVFNLLPILPLDGGHAAGAIYEGLRRQWAKLRGQEDPGPVDIARLLPLTYIVTLIMFLMGSIVILADLVSPISLFG
jgi:membrane-associated protease RseP (regulator of RpoE activity)